MFFAIKMLLENEAALTNTVLKQYFIMLSKEQQNIILAYNKGYRVDNDGNVWLGNKQRQLYKSWNTTKTRAYFAFAIRNEEGKPRPIKVHKLQAYQKFGDKIFEPGIVVRHLNDDSFDNSYENIEIGSISTNMKDMPKEKRIELAKHASKSLIKYNAEQVKAFYEKCKSYKETMEHFGIKSKSTLANIIKNR